MKTVQQKEINELCEKACMDAMEEYAVFVGDWRRLRYCTAEVFETKNFYILRSYATIVACIDKRKNSCYDFLRFAYGYTSTSAQHIAKFRRDYMTGSWDSRKCYTWRACK